MFETLSREHRLLLLEFVCAFAWTDLEIRDGERRFVRRLVDRLALAEEDRGQVDEWLAIAPSPGAVDPARVPVEHRRTFVETVRALIYSDGDVDAEERERFEALKRALSA
ncbi:MAG: TerB family tellurite resistance protein [Polyangiaceae bacterium]|nr:TerB family tellurite resistance protein [Polyangiaceae bacterium]